MDASGQDRDVLVQQASADLIADFSRCLGPFLRRHDGQLRSRVRVRDTSRLIDQDLESFQELPQLLDPHLPKFLPALAEAYIEHLQDRRRSSLLSTRSQLLEPISHAICRIIYAFCKIRGEKVIVRFLNVETKYLELLLHAIERSERPSDATKETVSAISWSWHERYVVLLWLSQLFFAPFDLSTISSGDVDDANRTMIPGLTWPSQIPGIALRVIPLGIRYLASPGKERDGAKALLVRLAMRKDMQEIGILQALVQWAISTLSPNKGGPVESPYYYIGSIAFLAGVLRAAADTSIMDPYLSSIYYATQAIASQDNPVFKVIYGSALARKTMIKVTRSVITLVLRKPRQTVEDTEMVENTIGCLLESLADNDTPVRFAASKALSVITLKLDPEMASQVVEAVLESLNRNVLVIKSQSGAKGPSRRDLTAVDPLEWHGLMLTLAHLLYRRSPPPENLTDIIHALLMGLAFEKRGTSGGSIGTNVRDAACFGIWAVARRYTTAELVRVPTKAVPIAYAHASPTSILQVIAAELVVAGSLDPAGNIRRGSSAALQELVGRHPDTIEQGIALVQVVDYHSVALRSRAIHEVALQATQLSPQYGHALLEALLGWRGMADTDAAARRVAAAAFGTLTAENAQLPLSESSLRFTELVDLLLERIRSLQVRQVEERHGLLLSLAAIVNFLPILLRGTKGEPASQFVDSLPIPKLVDGLVEILNDCRTTSYRKPELIAEAASVLVISFHPVLLLYIASRMPTAAEGFQAGNIVIVERQTEALLNSLRIIDGSEHDRPSKLDAMVDAMEHTVNSWLEINESEVMEVAAHAALVSLLYSRSTERARIIRSWADKIRFATKSRNRHGNGYFHALTEAYHIVSTSLDNSIGPKDITKALADRWASDDDVETRVAILQCLADQAILRERVSDFLPMILDGLNDYTTNARGDVGSHARLEAIRATRTLWEVLKKGGEPHHTIHEITPVLLPRILRLAAEKLDRVRAEAQPALALLLLPSHAEIFTTSSFSSKGYFACLFGLCRPDRFLESIAESWKLSETDCTSSLLAGLSTAADTGNEDLVIASRAAVAEFCEQSTDHISQICMALINNLKLHQGQDRVIVPTLELLAYLFQIGIMQRFKGLNLRQLCLLTQKAGYKSGNVRKIEACIKVYGGVGSMTEEEDTANAEMTSELGLMRQEGIAEARKRLGALLMHPWPRVRTLVVDELWGSTLLSEKTDVSGNRVAKLMSVDWGKADKAQIKNMVGELGLV
ncbi:tubulin folding cofactor D C terminal-domain-containing protein [Pseudomassariella vexata]|uniref:Tubulin folding cofactor D C terminal-domain-containing protein n=1 Tax=Pseudomassariella vexata TaxID=1141098 RepID=A0A1Y2DV10_9PEZI|nr:tubulin folding cofactor D C terminal-domain-containing protein [Pseudomassariella vexata]ORY62966.1 tubulin folding cofactor D C terminal-domain-containing protein [Pseudomassariella vexata]